MGPPGTGKSHIALSLTLAAIQAGYIALYRSAFDLVQDLVEAQAIHARRELIGRIRKVDLLGHRRPGRATPAAQRCGRPT